MGNKKGGTHSIARPDIEAEGPANLKMLNFNAG
jgi:hypothetical protein